MIPDMKDWDDGPDGPSPISGLLHPLKRMQYDVFILSENPNRDRQAAVPVLLISFSLLK